jgi:hypothetical protein
MNLLPLIIPCGRGRECSNQPDRRAELRAGIFSLVEHFSHLPRGQSLQMAGHVPCLVTICGSPPAAFSATAQNWFLARYNCQVFFTEAVCQIRPEYPDLF